MCICMDLQNLHWMVLDGKYASTSQSLKGNAQGVGVFSECLRDQIEGKRTSLRLCPGSKSLVVTRMWGYLYLVAYTSLSMTQEKNPIFQASSHSDTAFPVVDALQTSTPEAQPSICSLLPTVAFLFLKSKLVRSWSVLKCFGWQMYVDASLI